MSNPVGFPQQNNNPPALQFSFIDDKVSPTYDYADARGSSMNSFHNILNERTSAEHFDSGIGIEELEIQELIEAACQAPSAFNIQHWRFIAITDQRIREQLKATTMASNQERVANAPVTILILGDLEAYKRLDAILLESVQAKVLSPSIADVWLNAAKTMYSVDPRLARDEAIRSGSLAAMTLMFAAVDRGYITCPVGFDPVKVRELLNITDRYVPVIMVTIGRPIPGNTARRPRLPVDRVLAFNASDRFD